MKNQSMRLPLFAAALVLTAGAAMATEKSQTAPTAPEVAAAPAPAADGLSAAKVGQDPKTGELGAVTAAEDAELEAGMKAFWAQFGSVPHTVKKDRRTGRMSYVVAPTHMRATIATMGPDGKPVYDCFDSSTPATQAIAELKAKSPAQPAAREEQ